RACWTKAARFCPIEHPLDAGAHAIRGHRALVPERAAVRAFDSAGELLLQYAQHLVLADGGYIKIADVRVGVPLQGVDELVGVIRAAPSPLQRCMATLGGLLERQQARLCLPLRLTLLAP